MANPFVQVLRWLNGELQTLDKEFEEGLEEALEWARDFSEDHHEYVVKVYNDDGELVEEYKTHHPPHHHHHHHPEPYDGDGHGWR